MKRMKAFLAALLLFLVTVAGCHFYIRSQADISNPAFSMLPSEEKGKMRTGIMENMNEYSIPVFGSSEFQHGQDTPYHPAQVFAGTKFNPMLIGAGYYQSLSHAVTLASIESSMTQRKAVLILSPQWFRKTGVVDQAYASRFSETHYAGMMANEKLSDETKEYIAERTQKLLKPDEKMRERVPMYDQVLWKKSGNALEALREQSWSAFLKEKELFELSVLRKKSHLEKRAELPESDQEPDWESLLSQAQEEGERDNQNQFYMDAASYKRLEPHLAGKKDMNKDAVNGYQNSPEYDDLRCFLTVCRELEIEPMLVIVPVNGYYYDFTGFPKTAREGYYAKVKKVAEEFGARIADFSDQEYTKYFFEDRVHLGKKGWVMVNESIYEFFKEN